LTISHSELRGEIKFGDESLRAEMDARFDRLNPDA
jgi:hypothetical protein